MQEYGATLVFRGIFKEIKTMSTAHELSTDYSFTPESWYEVQTAAIEARETSDPVQDAFNRLVDLRIFGDATYFAYAETQTGSNYLYAGKIVFGADDSRAGHNVSRIIINQASSGKGGIHGYDIRDYFLDFDTGELMLIGSRVQLKTNADKWHFKLSTGPTVACNEATDEIRVGYGLNYQADLRTMLELSIFPGNVDQFLEDTAPFFVSRRRVKQENATSFHLHPVY